ncbi:unnamed protein product [Rotaria magnacalcarata]|uniref:Uncharacterized protein n=4 Tax=Rotaria magnacalcarata TaxID=392030 RepID=A0A8S2PGR0_9BILA|nr:unnamed protein product [Rotaria magnacalcarata]
MQVSRISAAPCQPRVIRVNPKSILSNNNINNAGVHGSLSVSPVTQKNLSLSFSNGALNSRSNFGLNRQSRVSPEERDSWYNITKQSQANRNNQRQLSGRQAWCLLCSVLAVGLIVCAVIGTDVAPPHRRQSQRRQQRQQQHPQRQHQRQLHQRQQQPRLHQPQQQLLLHQRRQAQHRHPRQQQPQLHRQQQHQRQQQPQRRQQQQVPQQQVRQQQVQQQQHQQQQARQHQRQQQPQRHQQQQLPQQQVRQQQVQQQQQQQPKQHQQHQLPLQLRRPAPQLQQLQKLQLQQQVPTTTTTTSPPCTKTPDTTGAIFSFATANIALTYTRYSYPFTASDSSSTVTFILTGDSGPGMHYWLIDDVSVNDTATNTNILVNGNFDLGSFIGWTQFCATNTNCGTGNYGRLTSSPCRSAAYCYMDKCNSGGYYDYLLQSFGTVTGNYYILSFYIRAYANGGPHLAFVMLS